MVLTLLSCLLMQADPRIERVERLLGDVRRPYHWAPLKITVASDVGFSGDLEVRSAYGFSVVRSIRLVAGGRETVILEALEPQKIILGKVEQPVARASLARNALVVLDARLPYASNMVSTNDIQYQRIEPADLERTLPRGLLEAADLVLLLEPSGPVPGRVRVAKTAEEAEKAVAELRSEEATVKLEDPLAWSTAPRGGWAPAKKSWALVFSVAYTFSVFALLGLTALRLPKYTLGVAVGAAVLGVAGYVALFPRSQLWVEGQSIEVVSERGEAFEWRVWFAGSAAELKTTLAFPRLVKPVFPDMSGVESPFTIRPGPRGCSVEGLTLGPRRTLCFAGVESRPPSLRRGSSLPVELWDAVWVEGGRATVVGHLPAGTAIPPEAPEGIRLPVDAFEAWRRFVGAKGIFGALESVGRPVGDIGSQDQGDVRERPRLFIERLP